MRQVILGSDWWTDCDDVMAVRILCNKHKQGVFDLLGICVNACMEKSIKSLSAFIQSHKLQIPLGLDADADDFGSWPPYQANLALNPAYFNSNAEAEDGVKFYRRLLAGAAGKVTLLEIGYPQVLANLLDSPADEYSDLNGMELVKAKVEHLWIMAGKWDENPGRENNFARNKRSAAGGAKVCSKWPGEITFLGFEIGADVISGGSLPEDDLVRKAMIDHGSGNGRSSWDPMLILLAAAGSPEAAGYSAVYGEASVDPETGLNYFERKASGRHRFVVKEHENEFYQTMIDRELVLLD